MLNYGLEIVPLSPYSSSAYCGEPCFLFRTEQVTRRCHAGLVSAVRLDSASNPWP